MNATTAPALTQADPEGEGEAGRLAALLPWALAAALAALWAGLTALWVAQALPGNRPAAALAWAFGSALTVALAVLAERERGRRAVRRLASQVAACAREPAEPRWFQGPDRFGPLLSALDGLAEVARKGQTGSPCGPNPADSSFLGLKQPMTRSGLYDFPSDSFEALTDTTASGEFPVADMVNRLDPRWLRWLDSSPTEQKFLGWDMARLREMSFLEIVHPDDVVRVREQLRVALSRGEVHGLVLRIRTAHGKQKAIEMNVGTRYGPDRSVSHLRCHVADVTAKLRAERELRLRTRELLQVNDQLRLINRELEELKERYRDLYQNAPTLYFSLDDSGVVLDCNETLLTTLGYRREQIIGLDYVTLIPAASRARTRERLAEFQRVGFIEVESQWTKANGEVIDVWISATAVRATDGRMLHSRSVAQDVTARRRLEAELKEKNESFARANAELSRRNREMDEFAYGVSHDLQEPLRTLIAFSDFLLRDYGDRLDAEGQEFVRYLVDASRRMRALIQDLLALCRAGKVTGEFAEVNLSDVLRVVRADIAELTRSKGAEVTVAEPMPRVWGDAPRLGQLLTNLVSNGLKYNDKADPKVVISASPAEETTEGGVPAVLVRVTDNGIGIEPEFHDKVFQLFRRLHTREEYEGTGAGLAICTKIVQAHGGRIWVESTPGLGSTFCFTLRGLPTADSPPPRPTRTSP